MAFRWSVIFQILAVLFRVSSPALPFEFIDEPSPDSEREPCGHGSTLGLVCPDCIYGDQDSLSLDFVSVQRRIATAEIQAETFQQAHVVGKVTI